MQQGGQYGQQQGQSYGTGQGWSGSSKDRGTLNMTNKGNFPSQGYHTGDNNRQYQQ